MDLSSVNFVAVAASAVAAFAFGAVYYTALGRQWMDAVGLIEGQVQKRSPVPFITSFVALLVMGSVLAAYFAQQGDAMSAGHVIQSSGTLWLGLVVTVTATNNAFRQAKPKLTVLDSIHWLGVLVIQGLVISAF